MIKCCIFDLDGTLFNTLPTITYYVNEIMKGEGCREISTDECCSFIGHGARHLIRSALSVSEVPTEEYLNLVLEKYNALYNSDTLYLTEPYDGIQEMLGELSRMGLRLGVLSNKPDSTVRDIVAARFGSVFDVVLGARDDTPLKPDPTALLQMIENLGLKADEVLYCGDTGIDVATGRAASVGLNVGVSWGFRPREELAMAGADFIADTPMELLQEAKRNA